MKKFFRFLFSLLVLIGIGIYHSVIYVQDFRLIMLGGAIFFFGGLFCFTVYPALNVVRGVCICLILIGVANIVASNFFTVTSHHIFFTAPFAIGSVLALISLSDHVPPAECWGS